MSQDLQVPSKSAAWTPEQVALVKKTVCKGTTDDELKLFMHVAVRSGLDPFARQIYAVKRKDNRTGQENMVIQTSIDGFRLIASRTNSYAGKDEAVFEYDQDAAHPTRCKVTIYKIVQGQRCAFTATARWEEYYPGDSQGFMWRKLPETMLEKCCEAKALRMAFPAEFSGLYSNEEMQQADKGRVAPEQPAEGDGVQDDDIYRIPFGQWKSRSLEEVYRNHGPQKIADYIAYLEESAKKKGVVLSGQVADFVQRAEEFLGVMEMETVSKEII